MKNLIMILLLMTGALMAKAQSGNVVAQSSVETTGGIGGYADAIYTFRQGEKITITGSASKQLSSVLIKNPGNKVLGRLKDLKKINYSFVMPADDSVIFHFVSDRGGSNKISFVISKEVAAAAH